MKIPVVRKSARGIVSKQVAWLLQGQCWPLECRGQIGRVELKDEKRLKVPFGDLGAVGEVVMGYECMSYEGDFAGVSVDWLKA